MVSFGAMDEGERRRFNEKIVMIYKQTLQTLLHFRRFRCHSHLFQKQFGNLIIHRERKNLLRQVALSTRMGRF